MLRAKAIKHARARSRPAQKLLASTDLHGQFAGIPIVVDVVNKVNATAARGLMKQQLGVHPDAWMPTLAAQRFRWGRVMNNPAHVAVNGERTPGKVAIYATCYVNYNEPGIGGRPGQAAGPQPDPLRDRREGAVLRHARLELGDLQGVAAPRPPTSRCWRAMPAKATPSSRRCPAAR
jgi:glycerol-3-phosphate dehydrogenase subunit C